MAPRQQQDDVLLYLKLHDLLMPWEWVILKLQGLLVWQRPWKSLLFIIFVHAFFWYIVLCEHTALFLICVTLLAVHSIDYWRNRVWPFITTLSLEDKGPFRYIAGFRWFRRSGSGGGGDTGWTREDTRLMTIHEICKAICSHNLRRKQITSIVTKFRQRHRFFFFLASIFVFGCIGYIGLFINGLTLIYITLSTILMLPSALYHRLSSRVSLLAAPFLDRLDQELTARSQLENPQEAEDEEALFRPPSPALREALRTDELSDSSEGESFLQFVPTVMQYSITSNSASLGSPTTEARNRIASGDTSSDGSEGGDAWDLDEEHFTPVQASRHHTTSKSRPSRQIRSAGDTRLHRQQLKHFPDDSSEDENDFEIIEPDR